MEVYSKLDGELLFYLADATWRSEAMKVLGRTDAETDLTECPEAQGEPSTLLRAAYEARQRALLKWKTEEREG